MSLTVDTSGASDVRRVDLVSEHQILDNDNLQSTAHDDTNMRSDMEDDAREETVSPARSGSDEDSDEEELVIPDWGADAFNRAWATALHRATVRKDAKIIGLIRVESKVESFWNYSLLYPRWPAPLPCELGQEGFKSFALRLMRENNVIDDQRVRCLYQHDTDQRSSVSSRTSAPWRFFFIFGPRRSEWWHSIN